MATMNNPEPKMFETERHPSTYGKCTARVRGKWYHAGIYMGEASCNWYVLVQAERGEWKAPTGERCDVCSIHGNGEIRWTVGTWDVHPGSEGGEHLRAVLALQATPWEEEKARKFETDLDHWNANYDLPL